MSKSRRLDRLRKGMRAVASMDDEEYDLVQQRFALEAELDELSTQSSKLETLMYDPVTKNANAMGIVDEHIEATQDRIIQIKRDIEKVKIRLANHRSKLNLDNL